MVTSPTDSVGVQGGGTAVGVVIPALDVAPWLDAMLGSLRSQTCRSWSAVVVDDGSTDGSFEIAADHASADTRICAVRNPNSGRGARNARTFGRSVIRTAPRYLYFPDADDILAPDLLERMVVTLDRHPLAVAAACRAERIDETGTAVSGSYWPKRFVLTPRWCRALRDDESTRFESIYAGAPVWEGLMMFRTAPFDAIGGWASAPDWQSHTSVDVLLRLSALGDVFYVPDAVYLWRIRNGQASANGAMIRCNDRALRALWQERAASDPLVAQLVARAEFLRRRRRLFCVWEMRACRLLQALRRVAGGTRPTAPPPVHQS